MEENFQKDILSNNEELSTPSMVSSTMQEEASSDCISIETTPSEATLSESFRGIERQENAEEDSFSSAEKEFSQNSFPKKDEIDPSTAPAAATARSREMKKESDHPSKLRGEVFQFLSGSFLNKYPWTITIFAAVALWSSVGVWQSYRTNFLISRIDKLETELEQTYRKQQQLTSQLHSAIRPDEVVHRLQSIGSTIAPSDEPSFLLYVREPEELYEDNTSSK